MKVAMIGTGGMARHHLRTLAEESDVEIVGHASPTPGHAAAAAQRWGGRAYTNHKALLEQEQPDAVWVSVPPDQHGAIEYSLLERRIPFMLEKPLAADWTTAEEIGNAISASSVIVAVGYNWRAMETVPSLRQTLRQYPPQMVLAAWHDATPPPEWWRRQDRSGGQMVEQATHLFDFARFLVGEATVVAASADHYPRPAYPDLDVATTSTALLRFDNDISGVFTATCLLHSSAEVYVKFVCNGLLITVERRRVLYDYGDEQREVEVNSDSVARENKAFLSAVHHNDPSLLYCTYADALQTHRLCCTVQEMAHQQEA